MWNLCGKFDGSSASFRGVQLSTFSFFSFLVCVAPRKDGKVLIDLIITGDLVFVLRRPCSMEFASVRGKHWQTETNAILFPRCFEHRFS